MRQTQRSTSVHEAHQIKRHTVDFWDNQRMVSAPYGPKNTKSCIIVPHSNIYPEFFFLNASLALVSVYLMTTRTSVMNPTETLRGSTALLNVSTPFGVQPVTAQIIYYTTHTFHSRLAVWFLIRPLYCSIIYSRARESSYCIHLTKIIPLHRVHTHTNSLLERGPLMTHYWPTIFGDEFRILRRSGMICSPECAHTWHKNFDAVERRVMYDAFNPIGQICF